MTPESGQYMVVLSGPSGSGKSTIAKELWKILPGRPALVALDDLKHIIRGNTSTDYYLNLASENGLLLVRNLLTRGHNVIVEKAFGSYAFAEPFIQTGTQRGILVYYFKLYASLEVLLARNKTRKHRLASRKVTRNFEFYRTHEHPQGVAIDTEMHTEKEVITFIKDIIARKTKT